MAHQHEGQGASVTQLDMTRRNVIPNARELAPETREAFTYFHAIWAEFSSLDPVIVDLCRLKSAHLNDCKW